MKPPIIGALAFALALAGSTGAAYLRRGDAPVQADSLHADSLRADSLAADSLHADSAAADSSGRPAAVHDSSAKTPAAGPPPKAADTVASRAAPAGAARAKVVQRIPDRTKAYAQLAKIFASMKTDDAVKVLAHMSDTEVEGVLRQMSVRTAADVLAALPQERAAVLSRRLLLAGGKP
jgi:hypothetical protein